MRRKRLPDQENPERRTVVVDRRSRRIDRRQFIDIGWPIRGERRVAAADRRQGGECRRQNVECRTLA